MTLMRKVAIVNARIEPDLKKKAENILHKVGLSSAEAIRIFYRQVCLQKGLPFDVKIPTKETVKAMQQADTRKTHKAASVDEIFDELK